MKHKTEDIADDEAQIRMRERAWDDDRSALRFHARSRFIWIEDGDRFIAGKDHYRKLARAALDAMTGIQTPRVAPRAQRKVEIRR